MDILITCPRCGREFEARETGRGLFQFPCPGGHYVAVRLPLEDAAPAGGTDGGVASGRSWGVRVGGGPRRVLKDGTYTLGRESAERPSDVSVPKGDKQASRRCAELSVAGADATLRVVKTVNPLRVAGSRVELTDGQTFRLPAGRPTTVTVGETDVVFDYI
ncbi:MAG: hypothetical protein K2M06_01400 [Muribaculaceae bacterium]|nr:hypothetical protein [Muribaculaceae bacterium]